MNIKETKEAIKVMQAFVEGENIEFQDSVGGWCCIKNIAWDWHSTKYRIKKKKIKLYKYAYKQDGVWKETKEFYKNITVLAGSDLYEFNDCIRLENNFIEVDE